MIRLSCMTLHGQLYKTQLQLLAAILSLKSAEMIVVYMGIVPPKSVRLAKNLKSSASVIQVIMAKIVIKVRIFKTTIGLQNLCIFIIFVESPWMSFDTTSSIQYEFQDTRLLNPTLNDIKVLFVTSTYAGPLAAASNADDSEYIAVRVSLI